VTQYLHTRGSWYRLQGDPPEWHDCPAPVLPAPKPATRDPVQEGIERLTAILQPLPATLNPAFDTTKRGLGFKP
jgi:hypothetical protein